MENNIEILIAEDSPTQALLLQKLLENNDYQVTVASNGIQALSLLEDRVPSLVISDIMMPEMNGYELCKAIKDHDELKTIPVILLTTLSEPEDVIKGLECGANHFITKPYEQESLLSSIQYVLINKKLRSGTRSEMGIEIFFSGNKHFINSDRIQILDLLFSSYENAVQQKQLLQQANNKLTEALETIKTLKGIVPICSYCKKIRDDKGYWSILEAYIEKHSDAQFSHGICPECELKEMAKLDSEW